MITASSFKQFDGSRFDDVPFVREYRALMLEMIKQNRPGFGLDFDISPDLISIQILDSNIVLYRTKLHNDLEISIVVKVVDDTSFEQYVEVTNRGLECTVLAYTWGFNVSMNRASYAQLTEGGPVPLPPSRNILRKSGTTTLCAYNPNLDTRLLARLNTNGQPHDVQHIEHKEACDAPLGVSVKNKISVPAGASVRFCASFLLLADTKQHTDFSGSDQFDFERIWESAKPRWKHNNRLTTYMLSRNVDYVLANCVVPISDTLATIIADHVALPLGWNRDN